MAKLPADAHAGKARTEKASKGDKDTLATGSVARSAKLASIPLSAMGRSAVGLADR